MNVLLNRHSGVFFISAGRKSDRATLGKQIKSRHGHLISKRQLLHDAVELRSFIPLDFFCAIYPQNDFIAEPVADTVRSQSKDESDPRTLFTAEHPTGSDQSHGQKSHTKHELKGLHLNLLWLSLAR